MAKLTSLEAYDLLKFAQSFLEKLEAARGGMDARRGRDAEKAWLGQAVERIRQVQPPAGLLDRVRLLPELEELREEALELLQGEWVDALERLHAGITFHAGARSPVIEALFPHLKFPALRRANSGTASEYLAELERKLKGGYVTRMFGAPEFAFVAPVVEQLQTAVARWRGFLAGESVSGIDVDGLREELLGAARGVELAVRQAKLLAEAALAPWDGAFEDAELHAKLKKRVGKPAPRPGEWVGDASAPAETAAPPDDAGAASESRALEPSGSDAEPSTDVPASDGEASTAELNAEAGALPDAAAPAAAMTSSSVDEPAATEPEAVPVADVAAGSPAPARPKKTRRKVASPAATEAAMATGAELPVKADAPAVGDAPDGEQVAPAPSGEAEAEAAAGSAEKKPPRTRKKAKVAADAPSETPLADAEAPAPEQSPL